MFINLAQNASKYQIQMRKRLNKNTTFQQRNLRERSTIQYSKQINKEKKEEKTEEWSQCLGDQFHTYKLDHTVI